MVPITFCPDSAAWGDIATWMAAVATLAAVGVAFRSSSKALEEARQLHRETMELHRANEAKAQRERDLNAVAVALVCHQGLIQLGAKIESIASAMEHLIETGGALRAYHLYFKLRPEDPLAVVAQLGDKLFTLPPDAVASMTVVMANCHTLERRPMAELDTAGADQTYNISSKMARALRAMIVNIEHALNQVTPIARRSRPEIIRHWQSDRSH